MSYEEAVEWMTGKRSWANNVPAEPYATCQARISEADAWAVQQAYWTLKAHAEGLFPGATKGTT